MLLCGALVEIYLAIYCTSQRFGHKVLTSTVYGVGIY